MITEICISTSTVIPHRTPVSTAQQIIIIFLIYRATPFCGVKNTSGATVAGVPFQFVSTPLVKFYTVFTIRLGIVRALWRWNFKEHTSTEKMV